MSIPLDPVSRLTKDLAKAAATLSPNEARFLVDAYYLMQEQRIRTGGQIRAMEAEPHEILQWFNTQSESLENQVKRALARYAEEHPVGQWALSIIGIGPVITAGLLANINLKPWRCALVKTGAAKKACRPKEPHGPQCDYEILHTVGHIWRFAGLDPTVKWEKGQKRPWNASLKRLCWIIGESFTKVSGNPEAFYGQVYAQRKALEIERNAAGKFADQAAASLAAKKYRDDTLAKKRYEAGELPDARLHLRAQRYAVKLFLAHLHEVWYKHEFGIDPPKPYVIEHLGHVHQIPVPRS